MPIYNVQVDDEITIYVMVYPGAVMLSLKGRVRRTDKRLDIEIGGYVLQYTHAAIDEDYQGLYVVGGAQMAAIPVERYNEERMAHADIQNRS